MNRKKFTLLTAIASTSLMAFAAIALASSNVNLYSARGQGEVVDGSVTWNTDSQKTKHGSSNKYSYHAKTSRGTDLIIYSYGQGNIANTHIFESKKNEYYDYGVFMSVEEASTTLFQYQSITSISITTSTRSDDGGSFAIYTDKTASGSAVVTQTVDTTEKTYTFTTEVEGANYLAIKPNNTLKWVSIKSITVNYSCEPGGGPIPDQYSISYIGMDSEYNPIPLVGIDESSLVTKAREGNSVQITPVVLSGYQYLGSFESTEYIEDYAENAGVISFTMPSHNITLCLVTRLAPAELTSISIGGDYQTEFTKGETFVFGGTVTAHYSDESSADVTGSATFTGYDLSTTGNQTVTVSYTENEIVKTTSYSIAVTESEGLYLTGTYYWTAREHATGSEYPTPSNNMTLTFTSNGKATWRNYRPGSYFTYDCSVFFDYTLAETENGYALSMTVCDGTQDDKIAYLQITSAETKKGNSATWFSGGNHDRPTNGGVLVDGVGNNSGVVSSDKASFTISVYKYASSTYSYHDTLTFALPS